MKNTIEILENNIKTIGEFIYKYRFFLAIFVFIICIILEISGSSINQWNTIVNTGISSEENLIHGKSRYIRWDEWCVFTPMMFSQCLNGFKYFSETIRATTTDVFMIYGLPVLNFVQIFRPFQIGFLFLGMAKGLSFFWVGRIIALFLISFEFFMVLTKKNKLLSFIGSVMITLSPQIQWWFAVNGTAELFIFGELALILLYKYMNSNSFIRRCIHLFFMIICAGGYALILYPAWQIPLIYVFLALATWIIIDNKKNCKISKKDIISIILALIILASCMGYIFTKSFDTIKTITSTAYPGNRVSLGGGVLEKYFYYPINIFLPDKTDGLEYNECESAVMFGLFPLGLFISIYAMIKNKKIDLPIILLQIVYVFMSTYCIIGFPKLLSKLTLLSHSTPERAILAIGFLDILILLRGISINTYTPKTLFSLIISGYLSAGIIIGCKFVLPNYLTRVMLIKMYIMVSFLFFLILKYNTKYGKAFFTIAIIIIMILAGFRVNPLTRGVDFIYDSPIIKEIQRINSIENGNWITCNVNAPIANYCLMAGVPIINCTNVYPYLDRWYKLDSDKKYEDIYNRYAHITVHLTNSKDEFLDKFETHQLDSFSVYLIPEDFKKLDAKYIITLTSLSSYDTESVNFELISVCRGYFIYKININT